MCGVGFEVGGQEPGVLGISLVAAGPEVLGQAEGRAEGPPSPPGVSGTVGAAELLDLGPNVPPVALVAGPRQPVGPETGDPRFPVAEQHQPGDAVGAVPGLQP